MKYISYTIAFIFIVHCTVINENCFTQWGPDVRLTNASGISNTTHNHAWSVASNGNLVHALFYDDRDGNQEIYYKRSTDAGTTWGTDTRLTNNTASSLMPSVSISGNIVHAVWHDNRDGNWEVYYKRSTDMGITWGVDTRITNNSATNWHPSMAVSGSNVHIVWRDNRDGNQEIYYKNSTDGGLTWGADVRLTINTSFSWMANIAVYNSFVHIVWQDNRDGNYEIYYKRSPDGGLSWGVDTRLTNNSAISEVPSISVSDQNVHIVWGDQRDGNKEIYYKRSSDGGISWGADTRFTSNSAISDYPCIAVYNSVLHIVWHDNRDGNTEIYYKPSTDGGLNWGTDTRLTNNPSSSEYTSVSIAGNNLHIVWQDNRDGNYEIYYKRDPTGNPTSISVTNTEIPKYFSLSQNYPNPFNPSTKIHFDVPRTDFIKLVVYDFLGREISSPVNHQLRPGTYEVDFDGSNMTSGVYFYKISTVNYTETKKMVLLK